MTSSSNANSARDVEASDQSLLIINNSWFATSHPIFLYFAVNDSPLGGREGSQLTGSMISDRLQREASSNIALQVMPAAKMEVRFKCRIFV